MMKELEFREQRLYQFIPNGAFMLLSLEIAQVMPAIHLGSNSCMIKVYENIVVCHTQQCSLNYDSPTATH